ncbi:MAG: hypothetical protein HN509_09230 [Halobacteriovoraceae bacterium]|nr:hypothetical protein [Halobacteriovoraceae bacterium]
MMDKDKFTDSLVGELKPVGRLMPPHYRFLIWALGFSLTSGLVMTYGQSFRAGSLSQLLAINYFSMGMLMGVTALLLAGYAVFCNVVPGQTISRKLSTASYILPLLSVGFFVADYFNPSFELSMAGKRGHCIYENIIYSLIGIGLALAMLRKGFVRPSGKFVYGLTLASGLVPALLMQMACVYIPGHGLKAHMAPVLAVMLAAFAIKLLYQKIRD